MPIKPKQRELRNNNITEPSDFDKEYDSLKGLINGGLDRQNLPVSGIDGSAFKDNCFVSYYNKYLKLDEEYTASPITERSSTGNFDDIPAQTYNSYAGGWFETENPLVINNLREGMCQIEFNCYYILNKINLTGLGPSVASPAPSIIDADIGYCQFQLTYNGNVIADTGKIMRNLQTVHLCASVPVQTGKGIFGVSWKFNGRKNDLTNYPLNMGQFYFSGGKILVINYYR